MPQVFNKRHGDAPDDAVYVGRGTKWGNPFVIGKDGTRDEVIQKFKDHYWKTGMFYSVRELRGHDLVCWCAPLPCHADFLLEKANEPEHEPDYEYCDAQERAEMRRAYDDGAD